MFNPCPVVQWLEVSDFQKSASTWGVWNPHRPKFPSGEARRLKRLAPVLTLVRRELSGDVAVTSPATLDVLHGHYGCEGTLRDPLGSRCIPALRSTMVHRYSSSIVSSCQPQSSNLLGCLFGYHHYLGRIPRIPWCLVNQVSPCPLHWGEQTLLHEPGFLVLRPMLKQVICSQAETSGSHWLGDTSIYGHSMGKRTWADFEVPESETTPPEELEEVHESSDSKRLLTVNLEAPRVPVVPAMLDPRLFLRWSSGPRWTSETRTPGPDAHGLGSWVGTGTSQYGKKDLGVPWWSRYPISIIPIISPLAKYFISVHPIYLYFSCL